MASSSSKRRSSPLQKPPPDPLPTLSTLSPAPPSLLSRFLRSHLPDSFTSSELLLFLRRRLHHHPLFSPYDLPLFLSAPFRHNHSTFEPMARLLASSFRLPSLRLLLRLLNSHPCLCSSPLFSCPRLPHIYRSSISAFSRCGLLSDASRTLSEARRSVDARLDASFYNPLIHAYARRGDHTRAVECFRLMINDRVKPDARTFNILIHSCCRNSDLASAGDWLRDMKDAGLEPDAVSLNTMLAGFVRRGRFEEGIRCAMEMGLAPTGATCDILIRGLCREGRSEEAKGVLEDWVRRGVVAEGFDCLVLVERLCEEGEAEKGLEVVRVMWEKGVEVGVVACTTLIEGLRGLGRVDEALGVVRMMVEKGMMPDRITFNCLVEDLCRGGRTGEAEKVRVFAERKGGFEADGATLAMLVLGFGREGRKEEGERVLDEMMDAGFVRNIAVYNRLMEGLESGK